MDKLLDKLSTFNIFNYFVPGVVFAFLVSKTTQYDLLIEENWFISLPFYYFCGLVLSSLGSKLSDWLQWIHLISPRKSESYKEYLEAKKEDPDISLLAEVRNMTRTFAMVFFVAALAKAVDFLCPQLSQPKASPFFLFLFFLILGSLLYASHNKTDRRIDERKKYLLSK